MGTSRVISHYLETKLHLDLSCQETTSAGEAELGCRRRNDNEELRKGVLALLVGEGEAGSHKYW